MFEQDRVLVRLQQRVLSEAHIFACFLSGSYGRRKEDRYSDLDVALVFADDATRDSAWQQRRAFVQSAMPYLHAKSFDAEHVRPYLHIALYGNGAKVDYRYESKETLQPNPWDRDIRILKDKDNWAAQFQAASTQTFFPQPHISSEALKELDTRFWVMFMDTFRLLLRGDYEKPFTIYLQLLHFTLPPLLRVLPVEDPAHQELLHASYSHNTKATTKQLAKLLHAYLAARTAVIRRLDLTFTTNDAFESSIKRLVARKT